MNGTILSNRISWGPDSLLLAMNLWLQLWWLGATGYSGWTLILTQRNWKRKQNKRKEPGLLQTDSLRTSGTDWDPTLEQFMKRDQEAVLVWFMSSIKCVSSFHSKCSSDFHQTAARLPNIASEDGNSKNWHLYATYRGCNVQPLWCSFTPKFKSILIIFVIYFRKCILIWDILENISLRIF